MEGMALRIACGTLTSPLDICSSGGMLFGYKPSNAAIGLVAGNHA